MNFHLHGTKVPEPAEQLLHALLVFPADCCKVRKIAEFINHDLHMSLASRNLSTVEADQSRLLTRIIRNAWMTVFGSDADETLIASGNGFSSVSSKEWIAEQRLAHAIGNYRRLIGGAYVFYNDVEIEWAKLQTTQIHKRRARKR